MGANVKSGLSVDRLEYGGTMGSHQEGTKTNPITMLEPKSLQNHLPKPRCSRWIWELVFSLEIAGTNLSRYGMFVRISNSDGRVGRAMVSCGPLSA